MFFNIKKKIFVLCYHSVDPGEYLHSVHPNEFNRQISYLKKNFQILSFKDFKEVLAGKRALQRNGVLITFDDGVQDNYLNAFPILQALNVPIVIFVSTEHVGQVHGGHRGNKFQFLTWEEMCSMTKTELVAIENHTHTHPLLTQISQAEVVEEYQKSNTLIQNNLGHMPSAVAYPKGKFNNEVEEVTKLYFDYAFTIAGGYSVVGKICQYKIPRILISKEVDFFKFKFLLTSFFWLLKRIKSFFVKKS